jgi:hypothetical protein
MIPPQHNAAFVAAMEDILELYRRPYDERFPLLCMDEQPVQLLKETHMPLPARPGQPGRYDHHYERAGTANIFLFAEPLGHWRAARVRQQRTAVDWAREVRALLEHDYPQAQKVILVCDNLNTHTVGSFYEAFPPAVARALVERVEIHHTPKHGSWLNVAECELSVLSRHCLRNRTGTITELLHKVEPWYQGRNASECTVDWQFTTQDARIRLRRLYPQYQTS